MSFQDQLPSSQIASTPQKAEPSTLQLIEREVEPRRPNPLLRLCYRVAAPKEPGSSADLKEREAYRRGQMISIVLFVLILIITTVWLSVGVFVNHILFPILAVLLCVLLIAIFLNRTSHILMAGILVVVIDDLAVALDIITSSGGIGVFHLPLLDIFIQGEILAIALLPAEWVLVVAAVHIAFIVSVLTWLPVHRTAELTALLHSATLADILARPISIQIFVAVGTYIWAKSAGKALKRADRATTIAMFEYSLSEQAQSEVEQRKQLDSSLQLIIEALTQFTNNKLSARIPLEQIDRQLWSIAESLNTLFARAQKLSLAEVQLERTQKAAQKFLLEIQRAQLQPILWQPTGTVLDAVAKDYNARMAGRNTR